MIIIISRIKLCDHRKNNLKDRDTMLYPQSSMIGKKLRQDQKRKKKVVLLELSLHALIN